MAGIIIHGDSGGDVAAGVLGAGAAGMAEGMVAKAELEDQLAITQARRQEMDLLALSVKLEKEKDAAQRAWNATRASTMMPNAPEDQGDVVLPHPTVNWTPAQRAVFDAAPTAQQGPMLDRLAMERASADKAQLSGEFAERIAYAENGVGLFDANGEFSAHALRLVQQAKELAAKYADGKIGEAAAREDIDKALVNARVAQIDLLKQQKMAVFFQARRDQILGQIEGSEQTGVLTDALERDLDHLSTVWDKYLDNKPGYDLKTVGTLAKLSAEDMETVTRFTLSRYEAMRSEREAMRSERDAMRSERDAMRSERDGMRSERDGPMHADAEEVNLSGMPLGDWLGDPENLSPSSSPRGYQPWGGYGQRPLSQKPNTGPSKAQQIQQALKDFISGKTRDMTNEERNEAVGAWLGKRGIHVPSGEDWVSKFLKMKKESLVKMDRGVDS